MAEREQSHAPRARRGWFDRLRLGAEGLVVLLLLGAAASYLLGGSLASGPDPRTQPTKVAPPPGLRLVAQPAATPVAAPLSASTASPRAVARLLRPLLRNPGLGAKVDALVTDLTSGQVLFHSGDGRVPPASTAKLLTSVAALEKLGPLHRFSTTVDQVPTARGHARRIVLVGGGDPFLAAKPDPTGYPRAADLLSLARGTAKALGAPTRGQPHDQADPRVRLAYDATLFSGPAVNPHWPKTYVPEGVVPPISALWVDEGHDPSGLGYVADPAKQAAQVFAADLERAGVLVAGKPVAQATPPHSTRLADVASPPLGQIVTSMLQVSDNNAAEVVARHVGLAEVGEGSFTGATHGVLAVLTRLGVDTSGVTLWDGSGLSRQDRLRPEVLMQAIHLAASAAHPELRQVVTGMPIAGFTGSLAFRFDTGSSYARGRVQAKTGTLSGVNALAGTMVDRSGDLLGFVVVADKVAEPKTIVSRDGIDRLVAALAACRCGSSP